jgi:hypothetical protein
LKWGGGSGYGDEAMGKAEISKPHEQRSEAAGTASEERVFKRHPELESPGFEGPWTEQDEIWLEVVTGEPRGSNGARVFDL